MPFPAKKIRIILKPCISREADFEQRYQITGHLIKHDFSIKIVNNRQAFPQILQIFAEIVAFSLSPSHFILFALSLSVPSSLSLTTPRPLSSVFRLLTFTAVFSKT
jgi:hypothetical protein